MLWQCVCGHPLEFPWKRCLFCRRRVAYSPQHDNMVTAPFADGNVYCANAKSHCNWLVATPSQWCLSCSLTRIIPLQSIPANRRAWRVFERAKRHLVASLLRLHLLPHYCRTIQGHRLEINLLQDQRDNENVAEEFVYTGHFNGIISINAREADVLQVESTRIQFKEKYRTLLGHLCHETGHYFWLALVAPQAARLDGFRALFGDERTDYQKALNDYYNKTPEENPAYVSVYAQMHPYEDWAETWAHYMHMNSTVAVAKRVGMLFADDADGFDTLLPHWRQLAAVVNAMAMALGHRPFYPFIVTPAVADKLRFIHQIIMEEGKTLNA